MIGELKKDSFSNEPAFKDLLKMDKESLEKRLEKAENDSAGLDELREQILNIKQLIKITKPNEIYYLCGQSSVTKSFTNPAETFKSNTLGLLNILERGTYDKICNHTGSFNSNNFSFFSLFR